MKIALVLRTVAAFALAGSGSARASEPPATRGDAPAPEERQQEFPEEYGTPATVIRAFYAALAEGDGDIAALAIVPEKTARGAFSAAEMSRFYGGLREPISLVDLFRTGDAEYIVHYRYAAATRRCDGRAVVRTATRNRQYFIEKISALNGC